jgi:DNA-binding winged helix-turn-helix (wHTH) protein
MASGDRVIFRFDEFSLDSVRGTLQGPDGAELALRPKAFALLCYLLERPGVLHAREALLDALWPGLAVTDDSLTQTVGDLRRALGDRATAVLRTMPRRGYVLVAPVLREVEPASPSAAPPARDAATTSLVLPPDSDLLVLEALEPDSGDAEAQRVADSLGAELLTAFSRSEQLRVLFRPARPLPAEAYRLSGTARLAGGEPTLSLVLEEAESNRVLWADQVVLPPPGQREEALAVLFARLETLATTEALRRARHKPPEALRAYDCVRLGYALFNRGEDNHTREAEQYFLRAIAMDPGIAIAHAYRALILLRHALHGTSAQDEAAERLEALDIARRAVELKPRSGLCLAVFAYALAISRQWDAAVENARAAIRLSTLSAISTRTVAASTLVICGEAIEAVAALQAAIALDTFCPPKSRCTLGIALGVAGQPEEALVELRRAAIHLPNFAPCLRAIIGAAVQLGRMEEAREAFARLRQIQPNWLAATRESLAYVRDQHLVDRVVAAFAACDDEAGGA